MLLSLLANQARQDAGHLDRQLLRLRKLAVRPARPPVLPDADQIQAAVPGNTVDPGTTSLVRTRWKTH
jgi:hypothetical protein